MKVSVNLTLNEARALSAFLTYDAAYGVNAELDKQVGSATLKLAKAANKRVAD